MQYFTPECGSVPVEVQIAHFRADTGVDEYHLVLCPTQDGRIDTQLVWLQQAYDQMLATLKLDTRSALLRRFFCSDLANQASALAARPFSDPHNTNEPCAVSWVGQPPAPPAKLALWAYHVHDPGGELDKRLADTTLIWSRGELSHCWTTGLMCPTAATPYDQAHHVFARYNDLLHARGMSLARHAVRTWLFVEDIHANYAAVVAARREFFHRHGLTPDTHFIASTGIEGRSVEATTRITLDAYAIAGLRSEQVEFLAAPEYLGPTHVYGVTFERGTAVTYRDRRHVIISGTASIDPQGEILYPGNLARQLDRTLENFEALLRKAGATLRDMGMLIAYVRDPGDVVAVRQQMHARCAATPTQVVAAHVCRPGWLVEVEGLAIVGAARPGLPLF